MSFRRIMAVLALAAGAASPAMAAVAYAPCAEFISSRIGEKAVTGELICWVETTVITYYHPHGPGHTETFYEGYYLTNNGIIRVDCETYKQIA